MEKLSVLNTRIAVNEQVAILNKNLEKMIKKNGFELFVFSCFILSILGHFKDTRSCILFVLHKKRIIDLRKKSSKEFTLKDIAIIIDENWKPKFKKKELYNAIKMTKVTFNKYFENFFEEHGLKDERTYTCQNVYDILDFWCDGDENILNTTIFYALNKKEVVNTLFNKNYKKLSMIYDEILTEGANSNHKVSPADIHRIIDYLADYDKNKKTVIYEDFVSTLLNY